MPPGSLTAIADLAFERLHAELSTFDHGSRSRGRAYYRDGAVGELEVAEGGVWADVLGTHRYHSGWAYDGARWRPSCDCPVAPECKHTYALALTLLEWAQASPGIEDGDLARLLSSARHAGVVQPTAVEKVSEPARPAGSRGRPAASQSIAPSPVAALDELRDSASVRDRFRALDRLAKESGLKQPPIGHGEFGHVLQLADVDRMCWELARGFAGANDGEVPEGLQPYLARADLAAQAAAEEAAEAKRALAAWVSRPAPRLQKRLRLVLGLAPAKHAGQLIVYQPRLTSAQLRDASRTPEQLRQLLYSTQRSAEPLSDSETRLLDALIHAYDQEQSLRYQPTLAASRQSPKAMMLLGLLPSPLVSWDAALAGRGFERFGLTPGEVVQFDHRPMELVPRLEPAPDGDARLQSTFLGPEGRQIAASDALWIVSRASNESERLFAVLCDGVLHPVRTSLPDPLALRLLRAGALTLDGAEARSYALGLRRVLPGSSAGLDAVLKRHPVRIVVALDLEVERDVLWFRVFGISRDLSWPPRAPLPPGGHVFELVGDDAWTDVRLSPADAETPSPDDERPSATTDAPQHPAEDADGAWLHAPEPEGLELVLAWLDTAAVKRASSGTGEQRRFVALGPTTLARLSDAWERRPAGVEWVGTREANALFDPRRTFRTRVSAKRSGVDLFEVSAEWDSEMQSLTDEDVAKLRSARTPWVRLRSGWARRDALSGMDEALDALADLGVEPGSGPQRLSLWQLAQVKPESLAQLEADGLDAASVASVRALRERIAAFRGLPRVPVPKGFRGKLRAYQRQGLDFLAWTASLGLGAVLADDMGLGKTIQALAWLLHLRAAEKRPRPALVVCPASVVHNWEREARAFAPTLRVGVFTSGADRHALLRSIGDFDLIITNYALLRLDLESWRDHDLLAVIADEAQMIKNPGAAVSRAVCELRAVHRLALTGTPLENRALDLWSIMRFVNPGYLGSEREFLARYDRADAPPHARRLLSARLRPVLLRRLKREVAPELPDRIEERRDCEMSVGQRKLYLDELRSAREQLAALSAAGGIHRHKIEILASLTRLRQICCHPSLVGARANVPSGKFEALFELLEPLLAEGHKVLVFSQFVQALELVRQQMRARGIRHQMLTGATTDRAKVVREFETSKEACVFLISLRAGGTGLNLTAAHYVVLLDPWWNPAVEAQAIDRTHRIGQERTVIAYRLLMTGTIEEKIWELQQRKAALASDILGEEGFAKTLDHEALEYLFEADRWLK